MINDKANNVGTLAVNLTNMLQVSKSWTTIKSSENFILKGYENVVGPLQQI